VDTVHEGCLTPCFISKQVKYVNAYFGGVRMKLKRFIVVIVSFFLAAGFFSWIGRIFSIPWLSFNFDYFDKGFFLSIGPMVPIIIGFIVSIYAEKLYINRFPQKISY
jgi:hypothetical protein